MNDLSQEALYNLTYAAVSFGDSLFQLWLTITFAAILAAYFAREQITSFMRWLILALYAGTSILLTGRWVNAMNHILSYREVLEHEGFAPFPSVVVFGNALGILHFIMFFMGSVATIYFLHTFRGSTTDGDISIR